MCSLDLEHGRVATDLQGHQGSVQVVIFDISSNNLVSGDASGKIKIWSS